MNYSKNKKRTNKRLLLGVILILLIISGSHWLVYSGVNEILGEGFSQISSVLEMRVVIKDVTQDILRYSELRLQTDKEEFKADSELFRELGCHRLESNNLADDKLNEEICNLFDDHVNVGDTIMSLTDTLAIELEREEAQTKDLENQKRKLLMQLKEQEAKIDLILKEHFWSTAFANTKGTRFMVLCSIIVSVLVSTLLIVSVYLLIRNKINHDGGPTYSEKTDYLSSSKVEKPAAGEIKKEPERKEIKRSE